jgi:xanthine dehydrogenase accessory factor
MDGADLQVLDATLDWLAAGRRVALFTVVQTFGSSPRPPGAWAVLRDDGALVGSVSGGCIEADLIRRVSAGDWSGQSARPAVLTYGVTAEEAGRFGLPCGGTVRLVVEPQPELDQLRRLRQRIAAGQITARTLDVVSGDVVLTDAANVDRLAWNGSTLTTVHGPRWRLLIIGAGQIAAYLASMAQALDYVVTVCDPREEYYGTWSVATAQLVTIMPDDAVAAFKVDSGTAVVALTHDPKLDDLALLEALRSPAFYVGALGSRLSSAKRKERLARYFEFTMTELARLHGPVGLPIGSRTPPEIAVSILAEITAVKNGASRASAPAELAAMPAPA